MSRKMFYRRFLVYALYVCAIIPPALFFIQVFILGPRLTSSQEIWDLNAYPPGSTIFFFCLLVLSALQVLMELKLSRKLLTESELPRSFVILSLVVLVFCLSLGLWVISNFMTTITYPLSQPI